MNLVQKLVKKYGPGLILGAATLDGYRRQLINDSGTATNDRLNQLEAQKQSLSNEEREFYDKTVEILFKDTKNKAAISNFSECANEHKTNVDRYKAPAFLP